MKNYIKDRIKWILLFLVFIIIFWIVFFLYDIEKEAVVYSAELCFLIGIIFLAADFIYYRKNHKTYENIFSNLPLFSDKLPKAGSLSEDDLQKIVIKLKEYLDLSETRIQTEKQDNLDYYATWAHQIKTPISVIKMILESDDTQEHRCLSAELFRIEQYVETALSYQRLSSESSDYVFKEYDLDNIIKESVHKYAPQFIGKKIRLKYNCTNIKVITDEKWLSFIIEQIFSNCVKYAAEGEVEISAQNGILKISDNGIGIAADDLPRIFEKGFTGYNGRTDKKATGLGLYLCKNAADKLSHKLWAESIAGKGTTVFLDLNQENMLCE